MRKSCAEILSDGLGKLVVVRLNEDPFTPVPDPTDKMACRSRVDYFVALEHLVAPEAVLIPASHALVDIENDEKGVRCKTKRSGLW